MGVPPTWRRSSSSAPLPSAAVARRTDPLYLPASGNGKSDLFAHSDVGLRPYEIEISSAARTANWRLSMAVNALPAEPCPLKALDLQYRGRALLPLCPSNDFLGLCAGKMCATIRHKTVIGIIEGHFGWQATIE